MDADLGAMAEARRPSVMDKEAQFYVTKEGAEFASMSEGVSTADGQEPTMEEMKTLRRVSGKIPWTAYTVTFVEFCERFSWYGTTAVFVNFIQQPRPYGSRTGNIQPFASCIDIMGEDACSQPGGLGQGQQASTGLTTFSQFWAYLMPLFGGYLADTYLGRYVVSSKQLHDVCCWMLTRTSDDPVGGPRCYHWPHPPHHILRPISHG